MNKIFHVRIYLYSKEEGGRSTPPFSGYRPTIFFGLEGENNKSSKRLLTTEEQSSSINIEGILYYHDKELLLGKDFDCYLYCPHKIEAEVGSKFLISELIHVMGHGTILKLIDTLPTKLNSPEKSKIDGAAINKYLKKHFPSR